MNASALTTILIFLAYTCVQAADFGVRGQLSAWAILVDENPEGQMGMRYIPEVSLSAELSSAWQLDAEAALDLNGFGLFDDWDDAEWDGDIDPYRLWLRLSSSRFEARAGLQKISFGSAMLLRPLMWFDTLDPRDPLQLTDGVYGLLGRYTFLNNANVWLWTLHGNDDLRGWETVSTDDDEPEFGGRVQLPVSTGELGLSYHHRRADPSGTAIESTSPEQGDFSEQRIGIDGKWDVGVGLWFEATVTRQDFDLPELRYERLLTVGTDYTFDIGNGPHALFEQFWRSRADVAFESGGNQPISALSVDYPLTLLDTVSAITYHDWDSHDWTHFFAWRRTYDRWQLHASTFWGPDQAAITTASYSGKGVQIMFVLNH